MLNSTDLARSLTTTTVAPRYDALKQFTDGPPRDAIDLRGAIRTFWAFGLVAAGVGMAVWLILLIHAAAFHPQTVGLLDRLTPAKPEAMTLTLPAGKVELPPALFSVSAYVLLILLTTIAARFGALMIRQGVSLLRRESAVEKPDNDADFALPPITSDP
jgi:hypothetical protein